MSAQGTGDARPSSIVDPREEETVQARLTFSEGVKQRFLEGSGSARVVYIKVTHFEVGRIEGDLEIVDDVKDKSGWQTSSPSSSLVAGTICSPQKDLPEKTNENESNRRFVQNNLTQHENVPQQRDQQNIEVSLKATNPDGKSSIPINEQPLFNNTIDPQQQGEGVHYLTGPSNTPVNDISDVSNNKSKSAQSKQPHSSTIPTDKATSDKGVSGANQALVLTKRHSIELSEKRRHTLFCALHNPDFSNCKSFTTPEDCSHCFDKEFADGLMQFLNGSDAANTNNEEEPSNVYMEYIEEHLKRKECPSFCTQLWKYCITNKLYRLMQYADTDFLVHSVHENKQDKIGTICKTYSGYRNMPVLGKGGFGKVYKYTSGFGPPLAIKEENNSLVVKCKKSHVPGKKCTELFQKIINLNHPRVIRMLEYAVGPCDKDGKQYYLFVMPFMNQKGFDEQFKEKNCKCVLDYMVLNQQSIEFVFRNYTVSFRHVFEGLSYLEDQGIVHRDVKASNILVHQHCSCQSPLLCKCPGDDGGVVYVLGDLDLLCLETECSPYGQEYWEKMARHDPAGTMGMKPPESFFRTGEGGLVMSHRSDVWSGCVAMMDILVGKETHTELHVEAKKLFEATMESTKGVTQTINESSNLLSRILTKVQTEYESEKGSSEAVNNIISELSTGLNNLHKLLTDGKSKLCRAQSFQGGENEVYEEDCPLAGILNTAYRAHSLQWVCLERLPLIYSTPLWVVLLRTLNIIAAGVRLLPEKRQHASAVVKALQTIYPKE